MHYDVSDTAKGNYPELARHFHTDGILIVTQLFSPEKMDEIESQLARYVDDFEQTGAIQSAVFEPGTGKKLRNLFHMQQYDPYFAELAQETELVDLARAIFDDHPISMGVELFGKPSRVGSEVPFHQDNAYFKYPVANCTLTVWVALADVTEANGCVRYLKGTHKLGDLPPTNPVA